VIEKRRDCVRTQSNIKFVGEGGTRIFTPQVWCEKDKAARRKARGEGKM